MTKYYHYTIMPHDTPIIVRVDDSPPKKGAGGDRDGMTPVKRVECYSGHTLHERPKVIYLDDRKLSVVRLEDRWLGPDHTYYKVLVDDGNTYLLRYDRETDSWAMEKLRTRLDNGPEARF